MAGIILPTKKLHRLGLTPYQFQLDCVAAMCNTPHKKIYNAYEQGMGKSAMAFMYGNTNHCKSILILTAASLRINWAREAHMWSTYNDMYHQAYAVLDGIDAGKLSTKRFIHPGDMPSPVIVSYNMMVSNPNLFKYLMSRDWDLIIGDEFHKARGLSSRTCQLAAQLIMKNKRFLALSGTPMCNSAIDLFPALFLMALEYKDYFNPEEYKLCTDIDSYVKEFCSVFSGRYGTRVTGIHRQQKLRDLLVRTPPIMFRKKKSEVMTDLPPIIFDRIDLNLKGETSVDRIASSQIKRLEEGYTFSRPNEEGANIMSTLRRELGMALVSCRETYEIIEDAIEADGCVIVGAYHKGAIQVLKETLSKKHKVVVVDGSVTPTNRQKYVDQFQNGEADVFIGQLAAAGTGINLSRAQQVIVVELDWLPDIINQFISRPHRIGQKGDVIAKFLCTKNPLHVRILNAIIRKQKAFDFVIDGLHEKILKNNEIPVDGLASLALR